MLKTKEHFQMRKFLVFIFFTYFFVSFVSADDIFNYYIRNNDGTFELKNISEDKIKYFRYRLIDNEKAKNIIGYYYGTDKIKFIDTVQNNRIISSNYYYYDRDVVFYETKYSYENDRLISIAINLMDGRLYYFCDIELDYLTDSIEITIKRLLKIKTDELHQTTTITGKSYLYNSKQPYLSLLNIIVDNGDNRLVYNTREEYNYYDNGNMEIYKITNTDTNKIVYIKEIEYDGNINNNIEIVNRFDENGDFIFQKKIINNNNEIQESICAVPNFNASQYYKIENVAECLIIRYDNDVNNPSCFLQCQDESVSFKTFEHNLYPETTTLKFNLDPFLDFPLIQNVFWGEAIWIE
jgi:hypothetical protein